MKEIKPDGKINWMTTEANELNNTIREAVASMSKVVAEMQENMLVADIINIYNGIFKTYDEYIDAVVRFNEISKHQNKSIIDDYTFRYTPEKTALTQRTFNYIKELKEKNGL